MRSKDNAPTIQDYESLFSHPQGKLNQSLLKRCIESKPDKVWSLFNTERTRKAHSGLGHTYYQKKSKMLQGLVSIHRNVLDEDNQPAASERQDFLRQSIERNPKLIKILLMKNIRLFDECLNLIPPVSTIPGSQSGFVDRYKMFVSILFSTEGLRDKLVSNHNFKMALYELAEDPKSESYREFNKTNIQQNKVDDIKNKVLENKHFLSYVMYYHELFGLNEVQLKKIHQKAAPGCQAYYLKQVNSIVKRFLNLFVSILISIFGDDVTLHKYGYTYYPETKLTKEWLKDFEESRQREGRRSPPHGMSANGRRTPTFYRDERYLVGEGSSGDDHDYQAGLLYFDSYNNEGQLAYSTMPVQASPVFNYDGLPVIYNQDLTTITEAGSAKANLGDAEPTADGRSPSPRTRQMDDHETEQRPRRRSVDQPGVLLRTNRQQNLKARDLTVPASGTLAVPISGRMRALSSSRDGAVSPVPSPRRSASAIPGQQPQAPTQTASTARFFTQNTSAYVTAKDQSGRTWVSFLDTGGERTTGVEVRERRSSLSSAVFRRQALLNSKDKPTRTGRNPSV